MVRWKIGLDIKTEIHKDRVMRRPSLQYPPFCDEKRKQSTKLGLLLE